MPLQVSANVHPDLLLELELDHSPATEFHDHLNLNLLSLLQSPAKIPFRYFLFHRGHDLAILLLRRLPNLKRVLDLFPR